MLEGKTDEDEVNVILSPSFKKIFKKLPAADLNLVEDQIEEIIANPEIGELKKGDLSYMRVHKFLMNNQSILLGYSWKDEELIIYLLCLGAHENFYRDAKKRRKQDKTLIQDE